MGTWSHEPFGNDDACDWSYELLDSNDLSYLRKLSELNSGVPKHFARRDVLLRSSDEKAEDGGD